MINNLNIRDLFGLASSFYILSDFIYNINPKTTALKMVSYLIIDICDILFIRPSFKYKYDILIHHFNIILLLYADSFLIESYYDKYFTIQEFTTVIIFARNLINNDYWKKLMNNILKISWIPIRLIIPLFTIYNKYITQTENSLSLKIISYCFLISYLLNIKWSLDFSKFYNNTYHFSSIFIFNFIFFMEKNIYWFTTGFIMTCVSFIHHSLKNRITKSMDASLITFINFKMINENLTLFKNLFIGVIGFIIKYLFPNSEIHSIIFGITIFKCVLNSNYLYFFNIITLGFGFYMFKIKNNTTIWHLSNSLAIINYMYINDLIEEQFLNFT